MTQKQLSEVTDDDIGHAVTVPRPASYNGGRRNFTGKLISFTRRPNPMGRAEYLLTLEYGGPSYNRDREQFGPLPGNYPIQVRHLWRDKEPGTTTIRLSRKPPTAQRRANPFSPPQT